MSLSPDFYWPVGLEADIPRDTPKMSRVKSLYHRICSGKMTDGAEIIEMVLELEKIIGRNFSNTEQFHYYVAEYLKCRDRVRETMGRRLFRARKKSRLTQGELADIIGVDRRTIVRWETTDSTPSQEAVEWMNLLNGSTGGNETFIKNRTNIASPSVPCKNPPEK